MDVNLRKRDINENGNHYQSFALWIILLESLLAALRRVWVWEVLDPEGGVRGQGRDGGETGGDHPGDGERLLILLRGRRQRHGGGAQQT